MVDLLELEAQREFLELPGGDGLSLACAGALSEVS
jgi:hypothetical protein